MSVEVCSSAPAGKLASSLFFFLRVVVGKSGKSKCQLRITDSLAWFDILGAAVLACAAVMNNKVQQGCFGKAAPRVFL